MPCYEPPPGREDYYRDFEHNSPVAEMLCFVLRYHEAHGRKVSEFTPAIQRWWAEHRLRDSERLKREEADAEKERLREAALSKLTEAEKKVLGIRRS